MIAKEPKLTLTQATRHWPGQPHPSTIWRACRKGVRAANGARIHLEHARFGRRVYTSREAIERFGQRLAAADAEHFAAPNGNEPRETRPTTTPTTRQKTIEAAKQRLAEDGI